MHRPVGSEAGRRAVSLRRERRLVPFQSCVLGMAAQASEGLKMGRALGVQSGRCALGPPRTDRTPRLERARAGGEMTRAFVALPQGKGCGGSGPARAEKDDRRGTWREDRRSWEGAEL